MSFNFHHMKCFLFPYKFSVHYMVCTYSNVLAQKVLSYHRPLTGNSKTIFIQQNCCYIGILLDK